MNKDEPINIIIKKEIYPERNPEPLFSEEVYPITHTARWNENLENNKYLRWAYDGRQRCICGVIHKDEDEKNGIFRGQR
jgi:hypothetical protein